jgi:ABC-type transporter Mla maintaining outer membrane lipid asymmetry ATPase subunit MlaF
VDAVITVRGLRKNYGGLRPLRLSALSVMPGERVALVGLDAPAAEVLVNLLTGAILPDQGDVHVLGRATSAIADADDWLSTLDRIGMVSARAVLAGELTVAQSIAMAFTLSLDPIPETVLTDVRRLACEAGLSGSHLDQRVADAAPLVKAQCRLARALAQRPSVLLLEHANALVPIEPAVFGRAIAALAKGRGLALIALTADEAFARSVADRVLALNVATGDVKALSGWRRWLPQVIARLT